MMDFFDFIIITMQITHTVSRKYASSSDESIENLVYYKDCQHKNKLTTEETPTFLREPASEKPRQPDCPYPKMCCALSCGNDCDDHKNVQPFTNRQMEPIQRSIEPQMPPHQPFLPVQPQLPKNRRKRLRAQTKLQPIPSRRHLGFTKDKIKSLIAQDEDIRKILKDLVRVTMQKVDLIELVNNEQGGKIAEVPKFTAEENE